MGYCIMCASVLYADELGAILEGGQLIWVFVGFIQQRGCGVVPTGDVAVSRFLVS